MEKHRMTLKLRSDKVGRTFWSIIRSIIIIGISYYILYPVFIKFSLAFMSKSDLYDITVRLIPRHFTMENISLIFSQLDYLTSLNNTTLLSLMTTLLQLSSCLLVGYGFARFDFWGKKILFGIVILTLLIPPQVLITPMYMRFRFFDIFGIFNLFTKTGGLNLLNTPWPFFLSAITCMGLRNGLFIFVIRQFFRNLPKELEDAALIDGAGYFRTFFYIMLPSSRPVITTVALFSFVWQWNDVFYVSWYMSKSQILAMKLDALANNILSLSIQSGTGSTMDIAYVTLINSTGCLFVILPLLILYVFAQKVFVESIERTGIVG